MILSYLENMPRSKPIIKLEDCNIAYYRVSQENYLYLDTNKETISIFWNVYPMLSFEIWKTVDSKAPRLRAQHQNIRFRRTT